MLYFGKLCRGAALLMLADLFCGGLSAAEAAAPCDEKLGREVFVLCVACHTVTKDEMKHEGPSLYGVYGRAAAADPRFKFSPALLASKWTWDAATLDRFLANPRRALGGTLMSFPGLDSASDRAAVICYLRQQAQ